MSTDKEKAIAQIQYEKKIQCLCQQLQEYSKQIGSLQEEIERLRGRLSLCCREQDDLKRQINQRDDVLACYESKYEEMRFEVKEKEKANQRVVDCLQEKVVTYHDQVQQKESCLIMCRNDVKSQEAALDEAKSDFACELQQRECSIKQMKDDLRRLYEDLKCKSEENCQMERLVTDYRARLNQVCCQLKEAEGRIACLHEKLQQMEFQSNREKCQGLKDVEEFERKLTQSCSDLCSCQNENRKLRRCLQEKEEEIHHIASEVNCLSREIQNEKLECSTHQERALNLENDNKEICRLLQQKIKCIKELEAALCVKEEELEQCRCCVDDLNATIRQLNTSGEKEDTTDIQAQLRHCREKLKKAELELEECRKKLEWAINEMENMAQEIKRLNCELDEARRQICEKNSLIGDLERTIEHAEQDMENRMRRVDEQLQKYEREIKDKTHMIAECEEKCCRYQHSLSDKEAEIEQAEQRLCRVNCEIGSLCSKAKELEELRDALQRKNNEQRAQFAELCQEYKCNREQLQCLSVECADAKRDLTCCQRELEKSRREADDIRMALQEKESTIYRLTEEKNCLSSKVTSLQCRLETETTQLTQQISDVRFRLEKEVEQMRGSQMEAEETNSSLAQKVSAGQRQLTQLEKCYFQKVDALSRENQCLQAKIADKEDQLQATKDCITLRDSEIMRLKLRLCSADRCTRDLGMGPECCLPMLGTNTMSCVPGVTKNRRRSTSCGGPRSCCRDWNLTKQRLMGNKDCTEC
uniref:Uncharacterized protein n=1 Tax=Arion vulgaris TaxID=1028688 RepID=A0A0B6YTA8_9EUPU